MANEDLGSSWPSHSGPGRGKGPASYTLGTPKQRNRGEQVLAARMARKKKQRAKSKAARRARRRQRKAKSA